MINQSQTQHITNILTNLTLPEYDKNEDEVINNNTKIRWWDVNSSTSCYHLGIALMRMGKQLLHDANSLKQTEENNMRLDLGEQR